jgi:hydroxyacylglutathione hydrolase
MAETASTVSQEEGVTEKSRSALGAGVLFTLLIMALPSAAGLAAGSMDVKWNEGAEDCSKTAQLPLQVHRYNEVTFILRENPCATYEAPFMYLLVGSTRALLIDSGDVSDPQAMPLARTVRSLLPAANFPLLVVHTHGHRDHRTGDGQFAGTAGVEVIGTSLQEVTRGLHLTDWPNGTATLDLGGGRTVDVIPTPGHYPSEVSYYDRATGLLFSGDFLLPGRLLIEDTAADLASARRVAQFLADRPVSYVLGGHIELDQAAQTFLGVHYHPNERALQLSKEDLLGLPDIVSGFNGFYGKHGIYILENQNRVLMAFAGALIALLVAAGFGVRALIRRRRQRVARAKPGDSRPGFQFNAHVRKDQ